MIEGALMSAGIIILITAGGGAFGAMLRAAQIGPAIHDLFAGRALGADLTILVLAFFISSILKFAQGSSTVAMITTAGMMAAMFDPASLSFNVVYLAIAIGAGSLVGSWMNDSGFWIYCKMGGITEREALRSWTVLLVVLAVTAMVVNVVLAAVLPMPARAASQAKDAMRIERLDPALDRLIDWTAKVEILAGATTGAKGPSG
jgi:H+/gluconate symporter-like permease